MNIKHPTPAAVTEPEEIVALHRADNGQLMLQRQGQAVPVTVSRCFPWSEPTRFISLRDGDDKEIALVEDLAELDDESRGVLELALAEIGFLFEVEGIESIEEEFEIRTWHVHTKQGERTFQTARDHWPLQAPGGGLIIRDVAGDMFYIAQPDALDERSRQILWAFVD
ncbi:DUF1854 domain-containing protein [bacterium]|nr:DUF1854 domain-containing protein [bacterium]